MIENDALDDSILKRVSGLMCRSISSRITCDCGEMLMETNFADAVGADTTVTTLYAFFLAMLVYPEGKPSSTLGLYANLHDMKSSSKEGSRGNGSRHRASSSSKSKRVRPRRSV